MKGKMKKVWTRNYNFNFMATLTRSLNSEFTVKFLKSTFPSVLGQGILGKTSLWASKAEKEKFDKRTEDLFLKNEESFKRFLIFYVKSKKNFEKICQKINSSNFKTISNSSLVKIYQDFNKANTEFMLIGQYGAFEMIELIPDILRQRLIKEKFNPAEIEKITAIVLTPFKTKAIERMDKETTEIAYKLKTKKISKVEQARNIKGLVKKYNWLPCMVIDAPLWEEEFFKARIKEIGQNPDLERMFKELREAGKIMRDKKKDFKSLLNKYPRLKEIFQIANQLTDLKDSRDEVRRFAYFLVRPLFYEISSRAKLEIDKILFLTPLEILDFLQKDILPSAKEFTRRKRSFIIYVANKKFKIYSGQQAIKFSKKYLKEEKFKKSEFSGTIASPGLVKARVRIVLDKTDLPKVKRGEILVAITTHPDYLPAMKRARAIVTDEGGLTCHAAIVSREFKIPCIVGTKIATKVLKNGDMIEVDAERGIVRKLK